MAKLKYDKFLLTYDCHISAHGKAGEGSRGGEEGGVIPRNIAPRAFVRPNQLEGKGCVHKHSEGEGNGEGGHLVLISAVGLLRSDEVGDLQKGIFNDTSDGAKINAKTCRVSLQN